jgi:Flp pilus assembly pilin Flp
MKVASEEAWGGPGALPSTQIRADQRHRGEEVKPVLTFADFRELFALLRRREEGQTMAEYGVVLAVITIGAVVAFTLLSGGIRGAINSVTGLL